MGRTRVLESSGIKECESLDSYLKKIEFLVKSDDIDKALECFDEVLELYPHNIDIYMEKADLYFDLGEKEKALECYDVAYKKIMQQE